MAGFTLIELLVVITIIGVLISVGVLSYQSTNKKARDGRRQSDLEQTRTALEIYRSDNGFYPDTLGALVPDYIAKLPIDPKPADFNYIYSPIGISPSFRSYDLCAHHELGSESDDFCGGGSACGGVCNYKVTNP